MALLTLSITYKSAVASSSPTLVREEVTDPPNDWWDYTLRQEYVGEPIANDLAAVSYFSDGQVLNATLFLHEQFVPEPSSFRPGYGALINVDSNSKTGWQGWDYMMRIGWDNRTKEWTYELQERSSVNVVRVLEQIPNEKVKNYTDFFPEIKYGKYGKYVHICL